MQRQPNWYAITMLPTYVALSQDALSAAKDQLHGLISCKTKPHLLDDHTINRIIKLCKSQNESTCMYLEQCNKWRQQNPSDEQLINLANVENNAKQLETINCQIVELVNKYFKNHTIDSILKKDDIELALDFFSGKLDLDV